MTVELKIVDFPEEAVIGQPVVIKVKLDLDNASSVSYAGLRLSAVRPCEKPLFIEQKEIFCNGSLMEGEYSRDVPIFLPAMLVPSSNQRGIKYKLEFYMRVPSDAGDETSEQEISDANEIVLIEERARNKALVVNPVVLAIKGLKLDLQKDIYKPGETIKIRYESKELRELKVLLMERSNIQCNCTQFGRICTQVPNIPSSTAGAAKTSNPTSGAMLLQVPKTAELSARHSWEPKEKSNWNDKFGDFNEWYLAVSGTKYTGEAVNFEIPIEIDEGTIASDKKEPVSFFETSRTTLKAEPGIDLFEIKKIKVLGVERTPDGISIELENEASTAFHGCTCKITGIKDMFFETTPYMIGFGTIDPGMQTRIDGKIMAGVSEINLEFDSNEGKLGSAKASVDA